MRDPSLPDPPTQWLLNWHVSVTSFAVSSSQGDAGEELGTCCWSLGKPKSPNRPWSIKRKTQNEKCFKPCHIGFKMSNLKALTPLTPPSKKNKKKSGNIYLAMISWLRNQNPPNIDASLSLYISPSQKNQDPSFILGGCLVEGLKQNNHSLWIQPFDSWLNISDNL